jgi:hypothetical protein
MYHTHTQSIVIVYAYADLGGEGELLRPTAYWETSKPNLH